jgi:hypothetical protein
VGQINFQVVPEQQDAAFGARRWLEGKVVQLVGSQESRQRMIDRLELGFLEAHQVAWCCCDQFMHRQAASRCIQTSYVSRDQLDVIKCHKKLGEPVAEFA